MSCSMPIKILNRDNGVVPNRKIPKVKYNFRDNKNIIEPLGDQANEYNCSDSVISFVEFLAGVRCQLMGNSSLLVCSFP